MLDRLEVALPEAEQDRAVELGVSADVVVLLRLELVAVLVRPTAGVVVAPFRPDGSGTPVLRFARQPAAAFEQQHLRPRRCQRMGDRAAAGAGSDDNDVVVITHGRLLQAIASGATHAPVAPRNLACEMTSRNSVRPASAISARRRFSTTTTPCRVFSVCGTTNGSAGSSAGTGP